MRFYEFGRKVFLVSLVVFLFFPSITSQARLAVTPLSMKLQATPGETAISTLTLRNTGQEDATVNLQVVDWWRTPEGNLQFQPPATRERSCADWLIYSPSSLTIPPDEEREVTIELEVPESASGDHWAMLLVTEEPKPAEEDQPVATQVTVNYAVKLLQQDPTTTKKEARISNIEEIGDKTSNQGTPLGLKITYKNTGPTHLQTTGRVEIRNQQGETAKTFEVDKFPTLPGEEHIIAVGKSEDEDRLEPGQYYAIVIMDFGGDHLIQGGLPVEIPEEEEESS